MQSSLDAGIGKMSLLGAAELQYETMMALIQNAIEFYQIYCPLFLAIQLQ